MKSQHFTATFLTDKAPQEVFNAVNDVRGWWTKDLEGSSQKLNDEFEVRFGDVHYSKQRLVEIVPHKKVVWLVTDSRLSFIKDKSEWTNTRIVFEISKAGNKTQLRFTHEGLLPAVECYDACSNAWGGYISGSLREMIGKGQNPDHSTRP